MIRRRRIRPDTRLYSGLREFLAETPRPGAHAIAIGSQWLDILHEDHGADSTLICFHSALTRKTRTLPHFNGRGLAEAAGMNLISVSDPTLELGDIDLSWFLGNRGLGNLRKWLSPAVKHLLGERNGILLGASGGGYAATLYGSDFPGHTVVAVNPRLSMLGRPEPAVTNYLKVAHKATTATAMRRLRREFVVDDLGEHYTQGLEFNMLLVQNQQDQVFRTHQAEPFLKRLKKDPRLHYLEGNWGDGHVVIPREELARILRNEI